MEGFTLGERIKNERQRIRLTQEQFGELVDISSAYIGQIERNERTPSLKSLKNIAKELNVSLDYLITGKEDAERLNRHIQYELEGTSDEQKKMFVEIIRVIKKY